MDGSICVESKENKGSLFRFSLPIVKVVQGEKLAEPTKVDSDIKHTSNHKIILICEDEESNYLYLKYMLKKEELTIIWAKNGKEVLQLFDSGTYPDLILMDIKMPVMDGIEATEILKNKYGFQNPIIAQTAYATFDEINTYSKHFDAFLTKPILRKELISKLNQFLENS